MTLEILDQPPIRQFSDPNFEAPFAWDDFQLNSFISIQDGKNVLVVAPTSSGKTAVGKYAVIHNVLNKGRRVVYTSPIKSLSNEKFAEMRDEFKPKGISVGLLTGDNKINVDSQVLVVTAEIIRNHLYKLRKKVEKEDGISDDFISSIGCVIMDEVHFISDPSRGKVWEDTLILLDPTIQLVMLSATVSKPEKFAQWICDIKERPTVLVRAYRRIVPLTHFLFVDRLHTIVNNDKFNPEQYLQAKDRFDTLAKTNHNKTLPISNSVRNLVAHLNKRDLLQAIMFSFSRKNCEKYANLISEKLVDPKFTADTLHMFDLKMGMYRKIFEKVPRYHELREMIGNGIAYHHSGLPTILKEIVELMFKAGRVRVLFATETFAVGVNMPARTVVFMELEKYTNGGRRLLTSAEFKQMGGRAGRRGLDTFGNVIVLITSVFPSDTTFRGLVFGDPPDIVSRMEIDYQSYMRLLLSTITDSKQFYERSMLRATIQRQISSTRTTYDEKNATLDRLKDVTIDANLVMQFEKYMQLKTVDTFGGFTITQSKQQIQERKALEQFVMKNRAAFTQYREIDQATQDVENLKASLELLDGYDEIIYNKKVEFLTQTDYIQDGEPQAKSILITLVNECNPILLVELLTRGLLDQLTVPQIVAVFSVFTEKLSPDTSSLAIESFTGIVDTVKYLDDQIETFTKIEEDMGVHNQSYWDISYDYANVSYRWAAGCSVHELLQYLSELEEYEGNFIKNMLKIVNIARSVRTMCDISGRVNLLPKLEQIDGTIIREFVNANSLHLQ